MLARLRAAVQALRGRFEPPPTCTRCADREARIDELKTEVTYWKAREERSTEALLMKTAGIAGVAQPPKPPAKNAVQAAITALGVHTIRKPSTDDSSEPGQGQMSGARRT